MRISIDWIKDFADLSEISAKDLRDRVTLSVAEVESIEEKGKFFEDIYVAQITKIEPHPNADKLHLVTFDVGRTEKKKVICGAFNLRIGLKSPYIPVNKTLPTGLTLEPKKIRGVISEGMLCSERELGFSDEHDGIMELSDDAPVGENLKTYFGEVSDVILDIDNQSLTHRPDLWGHFGFAREFSAVFQRKFVDPYNESWIKNVESFFTEVSPPIIPKVNIHSSCTAYWGLSLDNISVGPSPKWIKRRLEAGGLRSLNNIVDVSNYVMLELGIPLHIFDREKITGNQLYIEQLKREEVFETLDGSQRNLQDSDTVIRDSNKTLVLAAIMGGLDSSVSKNTKKIFIEVANWKAHDVRRTSMRLGLRTDASERYEKGLDNQLCYRSLLRAVELIKQLCPKTKVIGRPLYEGETLKRKKLIIPITIEKITKTLGMNISKKNILSIFDSLDFHVQHENNLLYVKIPSYRSTKDISCEEDLIEEVGRIVGYNAIVPAPPKCFVKPTQLSSFQFLQRRLKTFLSCYAKAFEVMTYPLIGKPLLEKALLEQKNELVLMNALSRNHDRMRSTLIPGILETLKLNIKTFNEYRFFEVAKVYQADIQYFSREHYHLSLTFYSQKASPFMSLVNTCEKMLSFADIPAILVHKNEKFKNSLVREDWSGLHPFEFYNVKIMGKLNGVVFSVHPTMLRNFKIKGHASIMIIDISSLEKTFRQDKTKYSPLPKYPLCHFDYCLEIDKNIQVEEVLSCLKKIRIKELISNKVVTVYQGSNHSKYITMRSTFLDHAKTLSGDFLKDAEKTVIKTLEQNGYLLKKG